MASRSSPASRLCRPALLERHAPRLHVGASELENAGVLDGQATQVARGGSRALAGQTGPDDRSGIAQMKQRTPFNRLSLLCPWGHAQEYWAQLAMSAECYSPPLVEPTASSDSKSCDVYVATLPSLRDRHLHVLDAPEQERRGTYRTVDDRDRFVLGAVLVRAVASRELQRDPRHIVVDRACHRCDKPHGRPQLSAADLDVSVSHSGDFVAVAVTRAGPVGVDIEQLRTLDYTIVLADVCTSEEQRFVATQEDFYTYWTRKEAFLKATGDGLLRPMRDIAVTPPDSAPAVLAVEGCSPPLSQMFDVPRIDGYAGAIVVLSSAPIRCTTTDATALLEDLAQGLPPAHVAPRPSAIPT